MLPEADHGAASYVASRGGLTKGPLLRERSPVKRYIRGLARDASSIANCVTLHAKKWN
jgi:hypothetical protein